MTIFLPPFGNGWPLSRPPLDVPFTINRNSIQAKGLVAWWPFLGSRYSNIIRDYASGAYPGSLTEGTWVTDPDTGVGITFINNTANAITGFAIPYSPPFTLVGWAKPTGTAEFRGLLGSINAGVENYIHLTTTIFRLRASAAAQSPINFTYTATGRMQLFVCTVDGGGNAVGYIDGLQVEAGSTTQTAWEIGNIGRFWDNNSNAFDGIISEVRLYNYALQPDMVWQLYNPPTRWQLYQPQPRIFPASPALNLEQEGFRFRADDGNETTATWLASQDTNINRATLTNTRLRMLINATGDPDSNQYQLEYRKVGDTDWKKVNP